jgi:hypothetical protein
MAEVLIGPTTKTTKNNKSQFTTNAQSINARTEMSLPHNFKGSGVLANGLTGIKNELVK